jgi:DUF1680 family protein
MLRFRLFALSAGVVLMLGSAWAAEPSPASGVPFTQVKVHDQFWAPRIATNREKSLAHNIKWCEQTGRISNFAKAAGLIPGKFEGIYFNDSDVYKVLEGAAYSLADRRDPGLEKTVDEIIAKIAAAQQPNGYLNTYFTLVAPEKRWTELQSKHEMYCGGHMIEAAVAHYRATGKRTFLDVAVKFANHLLDTFGPDKRHEIDGHEEIELALVKLYQVTNDERYAKLAQFFIDIHGDASQRSLFGPYCQDHMPVREQSEIVGHAVRAMYLYSGVADVASLSGDRALVAAMDRLWHDVVERKLYVTGGIGARHAGEAFGDPYELPNRTAYCETCAAIGLALWAHRLNLMHSDAQYADVLERTLYNGILSGVGLDGEKFFYVNPLASAGNHHRQPFFGCACCPTNVARFMPSVPGYVYAQSGRDIFVNLYAASTAKLTLGDTPVTFTQATRYPWDGQVRLGVELARPETFAVCLRIPQWAGEWGVRINGDRQTPRLVRGYARIERTWKSGDAIEIELPMAIQRVEAHPLVKDDAGRVAVQRGPIVYCFEQADQEMPVRTIVLAKDPQFTAEHRPELLGGVTVIKGVDVHGKPILAVPYYAWDHRQPGPMAVWVYQEGKSKTADPSDPTWKGELYRRLDAARLGPSEPLTLSMAEQMVATASHCHASDAVGALNDEIEPRNSNDSSIPRFTWWDHRGKREWVQYDFDENRKVSAVAVYWFDDTPRNGHCRPPRSWRLLYRDGENWKPVLGVGAYGVEVDRYNRVTFNPVTTTALRIEVELQGEYSGGILEWRVE